MPRLEAVVVLGVASSLAGCVGGAMTLYEENDDLALRGRADEYYTQGLRLSRVFPTDEAPAPTRQIGEESPIYEADETNAVGVVVGQNIYTPRDLQASKLLKDDRPYAGWLYAGLVLSKQRIKSLDREDDDQQTLEFDVGVVGDESLARSTQNDFHDLVDTREARGWNNQIGFEPGLIASYERRRRVFSAELPLGFGLDALPRYGVSLGNIDTHAGGGATVRFGFDLPRDFGVNTISTTAMETASSGSDGIPSIYVFGSGEGRGVARNIFLDGNTFKDSAHVDKDYVVGEFSAGVAFQYKALRLTYTWLTRSPEFHGQHGWTRYGSLSLGLFLEF